MSMTTKSLTIEVALGDRLNALERVLDTLRAEGADVLAFGSGQAPSSRLRTVFFRLVTENLCPVLGRLEKAGFPVVRIRA
jgi:hypothetical protein